MLKKIKSIFVHRCIETLLDWCSRGKDRAFLVVICDKDVTHFAFQNLEKLSSDGACAIGCTPEGAAMWETLQVGVDAMTDGMEKDPEWLKAVQKLPCDNKSWTWEFMDFKKNQGGMYK